PQFFSGMSVRSAAGAGAAQSSTTATTKVHHLRSRPVRAIVYRQDVAVCRAATAVTLPLAPALVAIERNDLGEDLGQRHRRRIADEALDLADVRDAPPHVLEALLVRFLVGHEDDGRRALGHVFHEVGELPDGDLLVGADVEDLGGRLAVAGEVDDGAHRIADPGEAARLL